MKRFSNLMPMQLQFFAEDNPNGGSPSGPALDNPNDANDDKLLNADDNSDYGNNEEDENDAKNANIIEKLQGRIGKEQSKKNELQQQLEQAQAELTKLKSGDKPAKEPKKTPEELKVEKLEKQLARRDIIDSTLEVFKESHIDMPKEIVSMFVNDDRDKTVENASTLLGFITNIKKDTEAKVRAEYAGGKVPSATKHQDSSSNFGVEVAKSGGTRAPLQSTY